MPKEKIASAATFVTPTGVEGVDYPAGALVANTKRLDLAIGWSPDLDIYPWVQVQVIPEGWTNTGEWITFDLDEDALNHMIRTLRRVKRKVVPRF